LYQKGLKGKNACNCKEKMVKGKNLKLKPSARDKRRYFLVNASTGSVEKAILEYLGVLGFAKSAYLFVKKSDKGSICSCLRESLNDVRAALAFGNINIEKVSGTLSGLSKR
jgi:RNase P/RNase MRP subunit POP5